MHARTSATQQGARVAALQAEVDRLQQELGPHEDAEKIVDRHIKLLHQYNEAKDATQMLIGRLANMKETTVREIHRELNLPESD
ncbi:rolly protein [Moniliophthora roreri MCA 2997]|uniref:Rolly protein n=1 Tax=Moniliophthora roreri (strain MCA 2997) TaxID=1381753 RepID=V2WR76_MONRO|nr:rolly protein [Moniliophthora roreri MCA 2997]KAI3597829.1 rolly protein [Moniliophthora roreri]